MAVKPTHITFELLSVTPKEKVEMVVWGPFASTSDKNAGVFAGILWDEQFALGLQCLNPKTVVTVKEQGEKALEGHCRDYEHPRPASAYGYNFMARYPGADVIGSKIALFGCPPDQTLATIEAIELAEKLPHVTLKGQWVKSLPGTPYLGFEFGERHHRPIHPGGGRLGHRVHLPSVAVADVGAFRAQEVAVSPWPRGVEGLHRQGAQGRPAGRRHTLSTFITADDAYVTPKPDPRLAASGSSTLIKDATEKDTVLEVADGAAFSAPGQKTCIRVGEELVMFGKVVGNKPARLEGCSRGAFGTKAQAHPGGREVARLIMTDFFGPIFLGNRELNREIAQRGAANCLEFGLDKYEFDGIEGTLSCGLEYSVPEFAQAWYDALGEKRGKVMLGGSGIDNYTNHIMDCVNWGEPWAPRSAMGCWTIASCAWSSTGAACCPICWGSTRRRCTPSPETASRSSTAAASRTSNGSWPCGPGTMRASPSRSRRTGRRTSAATEPRRSRP